MSYANAAYTTEENYMHRIPPDTDKNENLIVDKGTVEKQTNKRNSVVSEDYDPFSHREVAHPTTNAETLLHLLKGSIGTGILAMPHAFHNSGYLLGLVATVIIGVICTYCIHLLLKAEYDLCKRLKIPSLTFPGVAEAAILGGPKNCRKFAPYSIHLVNAFLIVYQLGTCCVYIVFISANVKSVADIYGEPIEIQYFMLMFLLPLILINWIRNLKRLALFSTGANVVTLVCFAIILYYVIEDKPTFEGRELFGDPQNYPLFFGTVLFALEAIGVIMPLENEMKTPQAFGRTFGVLNIGMVVIVSLYVGMGFLGYLTYGSAAAGSITLNIPKDQVLAQVVKVMYSLAIYISYALQCYVAIDITWNQYLLSKLQKHKHKLIFEYIVRTVLVILTFLLAVAIPKLELFISLFGALCLSALGITIPAFIDLFTYWEERTGVTFTYNLIKNMLLVIFGIFGLVIGTYTSLRDIVLEFSD